MELPFAAGPGLGCSSCGYAWPRLISRQQLFAESLARGATHVIRRHATMRKERGHSCPMPLGFETPHPGGMAENSTPFRRWVWPERAGLRRFGLQFRPASDQTQLRRRHVYSNRPPADSFKLRRRPVSRPAPPCRPGGGMALRSDPAEPRVCCRSASQSGSGLPDIGEKSCFWG